MLISIIRAAGWIDRGRKDCKIGVREGSAVGSGIFADRQYVGVKGEVYGVGVLGQGSAKFCRNALVRAESAVDEQAGDGKPPWHCYCVRSVQPGCGAHLEKLIRWAGNPKSIQLSGDAILSCAKIGHYGVQSQALQIVLTRNRVLRHHEKHTRFG